MAGFPEPEAGLVISYSYLWKEEEERGQTEGRKDRPCAIVLAVDDPDPKADGRKQVAVAPITHSPPHDPNVAVEIPLRVNAASIRRTTENLCSHVHEWRDS
jgi:hypothetical protein